MNIHITPSQREYANAHKARIARWWPTEPLVTNSMLALAWRVLDGENSLSIRRVQDVCCSYYKLSREAMLSIRRDKVHSLPRAVTIYLCCKLTERPYTEIGRRFGDRDHSTIIHSRQRIERLLLAGDETTSNDIDAIMFLLGEQS